MRLIIHDLNESYNKKVSEGFGKDGKELHIVSDNGTIKHCIGCFGCFVKTPGQCVIKDGYDNMGELGGRAEELIIISKCVYGTYSPFVRNVLDRLLSYIHPDFTRRNGEIHHKLRYNNRIKTKVYFYGDVSNEEKTTGEKVVKANIINFNGIVEEIKFLKGWEEIFNEGSFN